MRVNFWNSVPMKAERRGLLARAVAAAGALVLVAFTMATTGTARASSKAPADYIVASLPIVDVAPGGISTVFTYLKGELCLPPPPSPIGTETCDRLPMLLLSPIAVSGTTVWTDSSSPYFNDIVSEITNGLPRQIMWEVTEPGGSFRVFSAASERSFLDGQVGPTGVDLAGYTIDRIGFRVDEVTLDSPGRDPNGDGIWTDFALRGAFVFEGRIASREACMRGGWQSLHGPGGISFTNLGRCIGLVNTG
ncbi:MAG: hypothetical protein M3P18_05475 [Actinomycetota bacterium]|nr:hypothetical protein [Actinomycetota bacterium]